MPFVFTTQLAVYQMGCGCEDYCNTTVGGSKLSADSKYLFKCVRKPKRHLKVMADIQFLYEGITGKKQQRPAGTRQEIQCVSQKRHIDYVQSDK